MAKTDLAAEPIELQLLQVKEGDDRFLRNLYEDKRSGFINWFQKTYRIDKQQALDLFQKSFSVFYFNVKDGKIVTLKSTIDTYIFGIGKMLMKEQFKQESKAVPLEDIPDIQLADYGIFKAEETSHRQSLVRKILAHLEDPCKSLLVMYYFKNFSMESIALNMGYKNQGVVKKKKSLCLKWIRTQLRETNVVE
jgi:RNA polymerase sigma-70 factor (ECF subfamily)